MNTEEAIKILKKYHYDLLQIYADYSVYSKNENYNDRSLELAARANNVRIAVSHAITIMENQQIT